MTVDLLALYAGTQPDKPAVIDDRPGQAVVTWTFAELNGRANQLGHFLLDLGVGPSTKVIWCGQNSASLISATQAIRKIGAVGVPLELRRTLVQRTHDSVADREVVLDEVELRLLPRAEVDLVGIRHLDGAPPDLELDERRLRH